MRGALSLTSGPHRSVFYHYFALYFPQFESILLYHHFTNQVPRCSKTRSLAALHSAAFMRLLQRVQRANGETDSSLVEFIDNIPPYAILSHTWGTDHEEVTFKDIYKGQGKGRTKPGYEKLMFCAQQTTRDRIGYF